jgi:hypothetical protein
MFLTTVLSATGPHAMGTGISIGFVSIIPIQCLRNHSDSLATIMLP